jgi:ParB-like chromosome segregation protein Spo0J
MKKKVIKILKTKKKDTTSNIVGQILSIPLNKLDLNDKTYFFRKKSEIDKALLTSIKEIGQKVPIMVRPSPKNNNCYQIITGFKRVEVLKTLNKNVIVSIYKNITDEEALTLADLDAFNVTGLLGMKGQIKPYEIERSELPMLDGPVDAYKVYKKTKSGSKAAKKPIRRSPAADKRGK